MTTAHQRLRRSSVSITCILLLLATAYGSPGSTEIGTIAFVSMRDGNREIYLMDANGENQQRITTRSGDDDSPSWSPDGSQIAFMVRVNGNWDIWIMNADGEARQQAIATAAGDWE